MRLNGFKVLDDAHEDRRIFNHLCAWLGKLVRHDESVSICRDLG